MAETLPRQQAQISAAEAGMISGALCGTLAAAVPVASMGGGPFVLLYAGLFGTFPGLLVGTLLGALADVVAARLGRHPTLRECLLVGSAGACVTASIVMRLLMGTWTSGIAVGVAYALVPGLCAGGIWYALTSREGLRATRAIVASIVVLVVVQAALLTTTGAFTRANPEAYPGPLAPASGDTHPGPSSAAVP